MHEPEDFLEAVRRDDADALRRWLARRPGLAGLNLPDGSSPVTLAVRLGRTQALAALLEVGVAAWTTETDPQGPPTALMIAAARGDTAAVDLLLEHGADPVLRDNQGRSAADWAESRGHHDLARRLGPGIEAERSLWSGSPTDGCGAPRPGAAEADADRADGAGALLPDPAGGGGALLPGLVDEAAAPRPDPGTLAPGTLPPPEATPAPPPR